MCEIQTACEPAQVFTAAVILNKRIRMHSRSDPMTVSIREFRHGDAGISVLVDFATIAGCIEPDADTRQWSIPVICGMLSQRSDNYHLDDAYADAERSLTSPVSWSELRQWAARFFQIYDCVFRAVGPGTDEDLEIRCIDSTVWEVTTKSPHIIERLRGQFKDTTMIST